jgi:hypothetical protein
MYNNTLNAVREGAFEKCRKRFWGKGYDGKERIYVCTSMYVVLYILTLSGLKA